jgi:RNA polymerase sigma factor (sigma-70 family)
VTAVEAPTSSDDLALLRRYVETGAADAFATVVARHADFVFATALRQTRGDRHLAEDVTQAAFIVLARRARSLREGASVAGFLHQTTVYAGKNALRARDRRRRHEAAAAVDPAAPSAGTTSAESDEAAAVDDALTRLRDRDRRLIVLHYFDGLTVAEAAARLAITHEAARKRLHRALERLRELLHHAGVTTTAAALTATLAAIARPAADLHAPITIASAATAAGAGAFEIANAILRSIRVMMWKKAAAIAVTSVALAGGGAVVMLAANAPPKPLAASTTPPPAPPTVYNTIRVKGVTTTAAARPPASRPTGNFIIDYPRAFETAMTTKAQRAKLDAWRIDATNQNTLRVAEIGDLRKKIAATTAPADRDKLKAELQVALDEQTEVNRGLQAIAEQDGANAMIEIFKQIESAVAQAAAARSVELPPTKMPPYPTTHPASIQEARTLVLRRQISRPAGAPDLTEDVMKLLNGSSSPPPSLNTS